MGSNDTVTIQVKKETWKELNQRKEPGDTFNDVVAREIGVMGDEQ